MMNRFFTLLLAASCLTAVGQIDDSVGANSNWQLLLEFNGHEYWVLSEPLEWEPARDLCDSLGAYLYWPNDEVEHQAVWDLLPHGNDGVQFWTAIHQDFSVVECGTLNGGWVGPTGEIQTFLPWYPNEPNNGSSGRESVVQFEWDGIGSQFNDAPGQNQCDQGSTCECRFAHVILERETPSYCADASACNYGSAPALIAECYYTCCPGPGCCHQGTVWDSDLQQCIVANPSDSNFDGCVQLNDLLDLLSAYGDCGAEESLWQCGDPLEYQGYDYETVQIGEQCWFAENLRAENYRNGDVIPSISDASAWIAFGEGAWVWQENESSNSILGRLYNWHAVSDPRDVCPNGWSVFSIEDWGAMTSYLDDFGNVSTQLKSEILWPEGFEGENSSGFNGLPGGERNVEGSFTGMGEYARWWTVDTEGPYARSRGLNLSSTYGSYHYTHMGFSVRCLKDSE